MKESIFEKLIVGILAAFATIFVALVPIAILILILIFAYSYGWFTALILGDFIIAGAKTLFSYFGMTPNIIKSDIPNITMLFAFIGQFFVGGTINSNVLNLFKKKEEKTS